MKVEVAFRSDIWHRELLAKIRDGEAVTEEQMCRVSLEWKPYIIKAIIMRKIAG